MQKKTILSNFDLIVAALLLGLLVMLTMTGVIFRYFISRPLPWVEEVQTSLILGVIFLAGSAAFRKGEHMCMEFIYDKLPPKGMRALDIVIYTVTTFAVGYLGIQASKLVELYSRTNRMTSILRIPAPYIYVMIPIGCVLMIISNTVYFAGKIRESKKATIITGKEEMS